MKGLLLFVLLSFIITFNSFAKRNSPIIIDHTCVDLLRVPESYIVDARKEFRVSLGHKNHGAQIISGITLLKEMDNSIYLWDRYGGQSEGQEPFLCFKSGIPEGTTYSLGLPDWVNKTGNLLKQNEEEINVIMWSWEERLNMTSEAGVEWYLRKMDSLEKRYKNVTFIYFTGRLEGSGEEGKLNRYNNIIREFCMANNKVLYDNADLESYDPDGNYFLNRAADATLDYDGGNWADEYCERHPEECDSCFCYMTSCLNCQLKGKAFWWMMARMAGWNGINDMRAEITFDKNILDFGLIETEEISELTLEVKNTGDRILRITDMIITNNKDSVFTFVDAPEIPLFINARSSNTFTLSFTPPVDNGFYTAAFNMISNTGENYMEIKADYTGGVAVDDYEKDVLILNQNFPNPADKSTVIRFFLPNNGIVNISIYDIQGDEIFRLLDGIYKSKGVHDIELNTSNFLPGVYQYRISTGSMLKTKKMVIIR